jgi:hypothetical protein
VGATLRQERGNIPETVASVETKRKDFLAMKPFAPVFLIAITLSLAAAQPDVHVWEKVELTFHAANHYANPYTNVEVWVGLKGPGFDQRCFGFWDGSNVFRVRVLATQGSAPEAKIALFRSLFRGREDVYPRRFESRKTGRTGYQPACANEWVRGLCDKPRIK